MIGKIQSDCLSEEENGRLDTCISKDLLEEKEMCLQKAYRIYLAVGWAFPHL